MDNMITRLRSYRNGVHGQFFLEVAARLEASHTELVAIHAITMCIAECPPHREADTLTIKGVKNIVDLVRIAEQQSDAFRAERDELLVLERQYTQRQGEMARLCDTVCTWVLEHGNLEEDSPEVKASAEEIMEYVEAVRP